MFWVCPYYRQLDDKVVRDTNCLTTQAELELFACLWLRGLLPKQQSLVVGSPTWQVKGFGSISQRVGGIGHFFGDGSEGAFFSHARFRCVGWGVAQVIVDVELSGCVVAGGLFGSLGSILQTVPRAELWAAIVAIKHSQESMVFYTDHLLIFRKWKLGPSSTAKSKNQDLWQLSGRLCMDIRELW